MASAAPTESAEPALPRALLILQHLHGRPVHRQQDSERIVMPQRRAFSFKRVHQRVFDLQTMPPRLVHAAGELRIGTVTNVQVLRVASHTMAILDVAWVRAWAGVRYGHHDRVPLRAVLRVVVARDA